MAKSRRNRSGTGRRTDPVGGRSRPVKAPSDPALAALRNAKILPVVQELRSADPKTRTAAAGAVANIVEDARCRKLLLREQVVHIILSETLADSTIESRAAGWEVLNVLAQHEESDFCVHLFRCDVLTPAAHALAQVLETLQATEPPFARLTQAQQAFVWRIALSICDLVGQLAEARDEILQAVTGHETVTRALFALAASTVAPFEVQWAVLSCLARLCGDDDVDGGGNTDVLLKQRNLAQAIVDDPGRCYQALLRLQTAGGPLAVAACALLHAVFTALEWFDHSPGREGASDAVLVPVLAKAVEQQQQTKSVDGGPKEEHDPSAEVLSLALQTLAMIGTSLKTSLEKGNRDEAALKGSRKNGGQPTNGQGHGQEDGGSDEDEDIDEMMDDHEAEGAAKSTNGKKTDGGMDVDMEADEEDGMDMDRDMENVTGADAKDADAGADVTGLEDLPTLRELISAAVPPILRLVHPPLEATETDEVAVAVAVRLDALSVLNNVAWTVSCIDLDDEGNDGILQAWTPVARSIWLQVVRPFLAAVQPDFRVAAKTVGLAWALSRVLRGDTPCDDDEPARFLSLRDRCAGEKPKAEEQQEEDDPSQSVGVMCIGVVGQIARDQADMALNRAIGGRLIGLVEALPATPAAEAVEALNQLFDIYGDEAAACDEVFWKDGMLARLEAAAPKAKTLAKGIDKRALGELRTRADEASLNLGRFIQYEKKHAP